MNVHSSLIPKSPKLETTQASTNWWKDTDGSVSPRQSVNHLPRGTPATLNWEESPNFGVPGKRLITQTSQHWAVPLDISSRKDALNLKAQKTHSMVWGDSLQRGTRQLLAVPEIFRTVTEVTFSQTVTWDARVFLQESIPEQLWFTIGVKHNWFRHSTASLTGC